MTAPNATPLSRQRARRLHGGAGGRQHPWRRRRARPHALGGDQAHPQPRAPPGVTLFERGRVRPARDRGGAPAVPEAKQAVARAGARGGDDRRPPRRDRRASLSLAASDTTGEFLLPAGSPSFRLAHPGLRAQVDIVNSTGVLPACASAGATSAWWRGWTHSTSSRRSACGATRSWSSSRPGTAGRAGGRVAARELVGDPYLTRETGSGTRAVAAARSPSAGVELDAALELRQRPERQARPRGRRASHCSRGWRSRPSSRRAASTRCRCATAACTASCAPCAAAARRAPRRARSGHGWPRWAKTSATSDGCLALSAGSYHS